MIEFNLNKLRGTLVEHHMTQEKLAELLGVTKKTINHKLNNKTSFTIEEIVKLFNYIKIDKDNIHIFFSSKVT